MRTIRAGGTYSATAVELPLSREEAVRKRYYIGIRGENMTKCEVLKDDKSGLWYCHMKGFVCAMRMLLGYMEGEIK